MQDLRIPSKVFQISEEEIQNTGICIHVTNSYQGLFFIIYVFCYQCGIFIPVEDISLVALVSLTEVTIQSG